MMIRHGDARPLRGVELHQAMTQRIRQRASGRLRELHVEAVGHRVIVRGRAVSFYARQLVLAACREVLGRENLDHLLIDIQVES